MKCMKCASALLLTLFFHALSVAKSWTPSSYLNRRDVLVGGSVFAGGLVGRILNPEQVAATDDEDNRVISAAPIAVLGASGRTGALCVAACLKRGLPVRALTRSGNWPPEGMAALQATDNNKSLLSVASCDVRDPLALYQGIQGCRSVIYAASASKKGGNAKEIDNDGVAAAGEACLEANISRYVVLSSTAVTRPKSLGYIFTNVSVGGIMDEKRKGEQRVLAAYETADSTLSCTIVRPGGLEEPKKNEILGPASLEISQGDALAGIISRADLAEATVEIALSNAVNLRNTALEIYYTDSAQPCEGRFKPLLSNGAIPRLHGNTYEELFRDIQPKIDFYQP